MSKTVSPSVGRAYGLARVCQVWEVPRSSVYAAKQRRTQPVTIRARRGPKTTLSDAELTDCIRRVIDPSPFLGEGYRKVWARLRVAGIRASRPRVLRLMRAAQLLAPNRARRAPQPTAHEGQIITSRPNEMWGTDATSAWTLEGVGTISSPSTIAPASASGFMPPDGARVLRPWNPSARVCVSSSAAMTPRSLPACACGTTMAASS